MQRCDFNKDALQLVEITLSHGCSPVNFLQVFKTPFFKNTSVGLLLYDGVSFISWSLLLKVRMEF